MTKKYRLTTDGASGFIIQAVIDIPRFYVKAGDFGGRVANEESLSHEGDCWVDRSSIVLPGARVSGNALVRKGSVVQRMARVSGNSVILNSVIGVSCVVEGNAFVNWIVLNPCSEIKGDVCIESKYGLVCLPGVSQIESYKDYLFQGPTLSRGDIAVATRQKIGGIRVKCDDFQGSLQDYLPAISELYGLNQRREHEDFYNNFLKHFSE